MASLEDSTPRKKFYFSVLTVLPRDFPPVLIPITILLVSITPAPPHTGTPNTIATVRGVG